jgi:hypothetical protein
MSQYAGDSLAIDDAAEIPSTPGVYLWRRVLRFDPVQYAKFQAADAWLRKQAEAPLAILPQLRLSADPTARETGVRSSFVLIREVRIGAAKLEGREILPTKDDDRNLFLTTVEQLMSEFGPVLYVGSSGNLRNRVRDHLRGQTGFIGRLEECGLSLADVALSFVTLENQDESIRFQLEAVLTHLVGAPLTRKAGE